MTVAPNCRGGATYTRAIMSLKGILQGKWLGHPLHPALVHLPTGLWPAALIFDLVSRGGDGKNAAVRIAFGAIAVGVRYG